MKYYKIEMSSIPSVLLVNSINTLFYKKNHFDFEGKKPEIELTFVQKGVLRKRYPSENEKQVAAGQMSIRMPWEKFTHIYDGEGHHSHNIIFTGYQNITNTDANDVIRIYQAGLSSKTAVPTVFTLPEIVYQMPPKAEGIWRKMGTLFTFGNGGKDLRMLSCLFQLLAELTEVATLQAFKETRAAGMYSNALYSRRAAEYISQHLKEKITVSDIASSLGISNEYMCRIFKSETGQTLISYINMVKMETVRELISTQHLSLREAGKCVGIENEVYLYRLFKKYIGFTSMEYRKLRQK